jgi:hypothetical protein
MPDDKNLHVIFLGVAERASIVHDSGTILLKWNLLGLKSVILANFLPLRLSGLRWIFAIRFEDIRDSFGIRITDSDGAEVGSMKIQTAAGDPREPLIQKSGDSHVLTLMLPLYGYAIVALSFGETAIIAQKSGRYRVLHTGTEQEELVGEFEIALVDPAPLTPERIAAIKSDPAAAKAAKAELGCKNCPTKLQIYVALDPSTQIESEGYTWYQNIPDQFQCQCGKTSYSLLSMKRNLFAILGHRLFRDENAIFEPLYQEATLNNVRLELLKLIDKKPREESIQQFIQENPIVLHQFPSEKIFFKPPILTKFKADFCIVTPQKELILIEIERADIRLLKKDGGEAADLRHAFDQISGWLHVVDEHRLAVLDALGINREQVSQVRGVVIAGRDKGCDAEYLRRLKGLDRGRISFLTYDDLAFGLLSLARRISAL